MKINLSAVKFLLPFCALTVLVTPFGQSTFIAQANSNSASATAYKVTFNPPAGDKPQTSRAGGSRSIQSINQVEISDVPFSAVVPVSDQALTVASHPTVLASFPQTSAQQVLFSWRDENNNDHYQTILPLNNQGGIISLTLPKDAPPLEVGKNYQWALALIYDGKLHPDTPTIEGHIRRVNLEPAISERLKTANLLETAAIYGEAGIWYETVTTLAQLQTTEPEDHNLVSNWSDLLTSVGLENISQVPTINDLTSSHHI